MPGRTQTWAPILFCLSGRRTKSHGISIEVVATAEVLKVLGSGEGSAVLWASAARSTQDSETKQLL